MVSKGEAQMKVNKVRRTQRLLIIEVFSSVLA